MHDATDDVMSRLVESEARYRAFIENASDMIQSVRPDGTFEFVNRAWLRKLGYTPDDVPALTIWNIIHPDSLQHCQEAFQLVMAGQTLEHVAAVFVSKKGALLPVEGDATPRLVNGVVVATHSFFRDITERVRSMELEARNAQLERERHTRYLEKMAALGKLSAGLAHELNNPTSAAQRASDQLSDCLLRRDVALGALVAAGLTSEQWRTLNELVRREDPNAELDPLEISAREEAVSDLLHTRGIQRAWELAPRLVRVGVDPKLLETLAGSFGSALGPALACVAESLAIRELADVIARSTARISALVSAVKAYSHMGRAAEQHVDLHDGLEDTLIILGHRLKTMTVRKSYDRTLSRVRTFGNSLNQVWTNIIDNAADATAGRGTLDIRTRRSAGRVTVEIEDDGAGIPAEHQSRIFDPFFTTKPQGQGTGLGLDTAWRIITEEHQGTIEVESRQGRTVFRVVLPLTGEPAEAGTPS